MFFRSAEFKMPNFLKPFKNKGAANSAGDGQILTNRPFYLSPEHLSQHANALETSNCARVQNNAAPVTNDLPMLDQYSDPKDLIDTFKNSVQVEPYRNEEDQNYMVPFSESQEQHTNNTQSTTTVLHNKQRDSLSERLERGFNGEVYENIPTESPEHRQMESAEVSPSHMEDSFYETTWGTFTNNNNNSNSNNNNVNAVMVNNASNNISRNQTSDCYQNYNSQFHGPDPNEQMMYENTGVFGASAEMGNESRYANDNVFIGDDTLTGSSQIPIHDSRPDAEYDVPWTSAHAAAAASASVANTSQIQQPKVEHDSRRQVLKSSNSTDEFSPQPAARRRHKSGDPGKNILSKNTTTATAGYQQQQQQSKQITTTHQDIHQTKTMDFRPEDDYDQPWELAPGKRNSQAMRGNDSTLVAAQGDLGKIQFTDPTTDLRPEDDYDQPWNLTSKQPPKASGPAGNLEGSQSVEAFNSNHQKHQSSSAAAAAGNTNVATSSASEDRGFSSQHSSTHALHRNHHRGSQKHKSTARQASTSQQAAAGGEFVDSNVALEEQTWYHGQISRVAAEARLRPAPECSYLVRRSESSRHDYSLSIKSASNIMHMKIQYQESSRKYILGQFSKPYNSIPAMIAYYSKHTLNIKGAENVILLRPVPDTAENML